MAESDAGLWPHQVEAVEKVCAELRERGRATAVAACGAGKTLVGAVCSVRLVSDGRVLVLVPTLELLSQTAHSYLSHLGAAAGAIVAVCGDKQATDSADALRAHLTDLPIPITTDPTQVTEQADPSTPITTNPAQVAELAGQAGRITVFATYASLPVIVAAHAEYGLEPWGLVVVDEAHRTSGVKGQWARVHEDRHLPALRRLYLTATPRIMTAGGADSVSMDDPAVFGAQVFHLPFAAAIESGLLADYRVAVVTVTDSEVAQLAAAQRVVRVDGRAVSARTLAMQIALSKAIRDYRLRRVITYHGRVVGATRFAAGLPAAIDLLPETERPPWPVCARWVSGEVAPRHRRAALALLHDPGDSTAVISNARVLAEGVDVPALDAVMFADPRDSATDVVQAVGRALRRGRDSEKVATIIVPIFLTDGENPVAALDGSEFDTVWRVVRALRAHDERVADYLDRRRQDAWARALRPRELADIPRWLRLDGRMASIGDEFHRSIMVRTVQMATSAWFENYGALVAFHAEHGHGDVPYDYRTPDGRNLGRWLSQCRNDFRSGRLSAERVAKLAALGISWHPWTSRWASWLSALEEYRTEHGHCRVPFDYTTSDGRALGVWLDKCRRERRTGRLSPDRIAALEDFGLDWSPVSNRRNQQWQRGFAALLEYRAEHGDIRVATDHVTGSGFALGGWLNDCREAYKADRLPAARIARLEALGIDWYPGISRNSSRWETAFAALLAYRAEHGHANAPAKYVTAQGIRLGKWLHRCRAQYRSGQLPDERARQLADAGVVLAWGHHMWTQHLAALTEFRREHGHANPAQRDRAPDGFRLGTWVGKCRQAFRNRTLTPDQIRDLRSLGVDLGPQPGAGAQRRLARWQAGIDRLRTYRNTHGHTSVPATYRTAEGFALGSWLADCRLAHRDGDLPTEQITTLTSLGVDLSARRPTWNERIAQLTAYRHEHGHVEVPSSHDGGLGTWLSKQRRNLRENELDNRRAASLRALGVTPAAPRRTSPPRSA